MNAVASKSEPPAPVQGLIAHKYEVIRRIGQGGMGSVWEGRHVALGTAVAIKFIDAEHAQSNDARSRFENEAKAAATLRSKHAIQVFDYGVSQEGVPYIVMEYLEGMSLAARLRTAKKLSLLDTTRILVPVCRAIQQAHDKSIIHRDLKPENIFLVRHQDDDEEMVKVLDFGIAKVRSPHRTTDSSSTEVGTIVGTPHFMPPEQARGLKTIDHRADLWAIGVLAFRCLTGRLPFEGENLADLLVKVCMAAVPVPSELEPHLPKEFDAWFQRALQREPEARFQSARAMADDLARIAGFPLRREPGSHGASTSSPDLSPGGLPSERELSSQIRANGAGLAAPPSAPTRREGPNLVRELVGEDEGTHSPFSGSVRMTQVPRKTFAYVAAAGLIVGGAMVVAFRSSSVREAPAQTAAARPPPASVVGTGDVAMPKGQTAPGEAAPGEAASDPRSLGASPLAPSANGPTTAPGATGLGTGSKGLRQDKKTDKPSVDKADKGEPPANGSRQRGKGNGKPPTNPTPASHELDPGY